MDRKSWVKWGNLWLLQWSRCCVVLSHESSETITAIATAVLALAAVVAFVVSVIVYKGQGALSERISKEQGALSEKISKQQAAISLQIHEQQRLLSQRQLLIPLWDYISNVRNIDIQNPAEAQVLKLVNTLELVAVSCEGGMVDANVIKRTFKDVYLRLYDQVVAVTKLPGLNLTGTDLLRQNPAAMKFYDELRKEFTEHGKLG